MAEPFKIATSDGDYEHDRRDPTCAAGWCSGEYGSFPAPCENEGCPGLVHADFGNENSDGDYWLHAECDTCGAT